VVAATVPLFLIVALVAALPHLAPPPVSRPAPARSPASGVLGQSITLPVRPSSQPAPILLNAGEVLARGSQGESVTMLQARLRQLGYFTYPQDTGYFGDATYGAVFTFQAAHGLPANGVADAATVDALNACDPSCAR
jgi:hypothetical protein